MAKAYDEGSDRDKAAASAARRAYAASGTANNPKAQGHGFCREARAHGKSDRPHGRGQRD